MTASDADLRIDCRAGLDGWICDVTVSEDRSQTQHEVSVSEEEMRRYGVPSSSVVGLVSGAFSFLLEREPNTSILKEFDLSVINRYFPEFEDAIAERLGRR